MFGGEFQVSIASGARTASPVSAPSIRNSAPSAKHNGIRIFRAVGGGYWKPSCRSRVSTGFVRQRTDPTLQARKTGHALLIETSAATQRPGKLVHNMLWTIAVILLVLWALGMVTSYTLGGFIHLLLVLAIIVVLIRLIQGRSPVA